MVDVKYVLVFFEMSDVKKGELEAVYPNANYTYARPSTVNQELVDSADVILGSCPPKMLANCKNLKWIQLGSAGSNHFQTSGVFPKDTILTNASGGYGLAIAEHLLGMLLIVMKKMHLYRDNQNQAKWQDEGDILPIYGSTTLVIGLGDIGGEFGKRMRALGSHVIGVRRSNAQKPDYVDEIHLTSDIDALLPQADIIALAVPETDETKHILSAERIGMLKKTAIVLNVGRGSAIDQDALIEALEKGNIYGAGLDVTDPEPLPADSKLWKMKNAFITPHISGGYHLEETYKRIIDICISNYKAYINETPMRNVVDFDRQY